MSLQASSGGEPTARSVSHTTISETQPQPQTSERRGKFTFLDRLKYLLFTFHPGTLGDPVNIIANYIKILTKPQWELFQYHIEFRPDIENKRFRREIIAQHRVNH